MTMVLDCGILCLMSIVILLLTGYILYRLIRHPIKTLGLVFKTVALLALGLLAWGGLFYYLMV